MSKTYSAGIVTAYGAAKRAGYQGTYEDFCRQQAGYAGNAAAVEAAKNTAVSAAETASAKATEASGYANEAKGYKNNASQSATSANHMASVAGNRANDAQGYATSASQSAETASAKATEAQGYAQSAQNVLNSIPADYSQMSADVEQLKADSGDLIPVNLASDVSYTDGRALYYDTGEMFVLSNFAVTDYIDITGIEKIWYKNLMSTSSTTRIGIAFYDENKTYLSGVVCIKGASESAWIFSEATVPENAVYVRVPCLKSEKPTFIYDKTDYEKKLIGRVNLLETDVLSVKSETSNINDYLGHISADGYFKLNPAYWELGGYTSYTGKDSRTYRVRYKNVLSFPYPVYVLADKGYKVDGYKEGGVAFGADTTILVPANTNFKIYVRRYTENTSETVNIETFANAIKLSTALAPISLYEPTFTDVSMFERMGVSGDSYSAGGGIISGITALTWGKNLQRQSGVQVDIYAKSGDSIVDWVQNQTKGLPALLAGTECGLYWFQHGINGTSTAAMLGTPADMEADPKPNTFYGQYAYAIEAVKAAFPKARIVLATIVGSDWGLTQGQYSAANVAIKAIAEYEEVPCIDISEDDFFRSKFYQNYTASNHPTAMQAAGMAMAYRRLISKCIQANPNYFKNYGSNS